MVARADTARLTPPTASSDSGAPTLAGVGGTVAGVTVAIACLAGPAGLLESFVVRSGVGALVNAAAPPLGLTARVVLGAGGGLLVAAVAWAVLVLVAGDRRLPTSLPPLRLPARRMKRLSGGQAVRRADSHPDAPPRPPILAERDLGAPFLSVVAPEQSAPAADEYALPADLDTALAAVDPAAIPDVPREPVRAVSSLAIVAPPQSAPSIAPALASSPPLAPGERIDSIELGADVRDRPDTIESLLARLERGALRRAVPVIGPFPEPEHEAVGTEPRGGSLEETLGSLRRLATRG